MSHTVSPYTVKIMQATIESRTFVLPKLSFQNMEIEVVEGTTGES